MGFGFSVYNSEYVMLKAQDHGFQGPVFFVVMGSKPELPGVLKRCIL